MALPSALNILKTGVELVDRTFQNVKETVDQLLSAPLLRGKQLTDLPLNSGTTLVTHQLGRVPQGYIITGQSGPANISRSAQAARTPEQQISLQSSAAVTVDLWVY